MKIIRYDESMRTVWNQFVDSSRNATFLFNRGYMDYHSDRFHDYSWLAYKGDRILALFPGNLDNDGTLHSHQGLTYGGWLLPPAHLNGADLLDIFALALKTWKSEGIKSLEYKTIPFIYHTQPSQEDEYALFRLGARLIETNLSMAIDLQRPHKFNQMQRRHLSKASLLSYSIEETSNAESFISLISECLKSRHNAKPVHTPEELQHLINLFPHNIRLHTINLEGKIQAGVAIYETQTVAHCQYIGSTPQARSLNLLTPLFDYLINNRYFHKRFFDFGTSNQSIGDHLNRSLLMQKASFGASGIAYNRYLINL